MKLRSAQFIILAIIIGIMVHAGRRPRTVPKKVYWNSPGFAVVELFTSEDCTKCPASERLLYELNDYAREENFPIYSVVYHLNEAAKQETRRLQDYLGKNAELQIPCFVINGQVFTGTSVEDFRDAVGRKLTVKPDVRFRIGADRKGDRVDVTCKVSDPENKVAVAVLVEIEARHDVSLRRFAAADGKLGERFTIPLHIPPDVKAENAQIFAFLQDASTNEIVAADRSWLPKPEPQAKKPEEVLDDETKKILGKESKEKIEHLMKEGEITTTLPEHID